MALVRGRAEDLRMEAVRLAAAYRKLDVDDATAAADTAAIIRAWQSAGPTTSAAPPGGDAADESIPEGGQEDHREGYAHVR